MPLTDEEMAVLDIIARYNFLDNCVDNGYITEEKFEEILFGFGPKNHEMVSYYIERMNDHTKDTSRYLDSLQGKPKSVAALPDTVDGLADQIIAEMDQEERIKISNLSEKNLEPLQMALGLYSRKQFDKRPVNEDEQDLADAFAPEKVVKRVWEKLREIYS